MSDIAQDFIKSMRADIERQQKKLVGGHIANMEDYHKVCGKIYAYSRAIDTFQAVVKKHLRADDEEEENGI